MSELFTEPQIDRMRINANIEGATVHEMGTVRPDVARLIASKVAVPNTALHRFAAGESPEYEELGREIRILHEHTRDEEVLSWIEALCFYVVIDEMRENGELTDEDCQ